MVFASGTSLVQFPDEGKVLVRNLRDQGADIVRDENDDKFQVKFRPLNFSINQYISNALT